MRAILGGAGVMCLTSLLGGCGPDLDDCRTLLTCEPPPGGAGGVGGTAEGGGGSGGTATLPIGDPCNQAGHCASGQCIDGVCCDTACNGECSACNVAESVGTCSPLPAGTDPNSECGAGNCDGGGTCAQADHVWSVGLPGSADVFVTGIAVDVGGNVLVAGEAHWGNLDLGGGSFAATIVPFIAKYTANGDFAWQQLITGSGDAINNRIHGIDVDGQGNVFATGTLGDSTVNIGGFTHNNQSGNDIWVAKFSPVGNRQWSKSFGQQGGATPYGGSIAVSADGNSVITGGKSLTGGAISVGGDTVHSNDLMFAARYDPDGNYLWHYSAGARVGNASVAMDSGGNPYFAGGFSGSVSFATVGCSFDDSNAGNRGPVYLLKRGAITGQHAWCAEFGDDSVRFDTFVRHVGVSVASGGDVALWGDFSGSINFGGSPLVDSTGANFLAIMDTNGKHAWSQGLDADIANATVTETRVVVTGKFGKTVDFGSGPLEPTGGDDLFVAQFSASGSPLMTRKFGDAVDQAGALNAVGPDGSIYIAGSPGDGPIDLGGGALGTPLYVARLTP